MSMNLHCEEIEIPIQVSTVISNLCFYSSLIKGTQGHWKDIREKFILWYRDTGNESQDWDFIYSFIDKMRSKKKLTFYIS